MVVALQTPPYTSAPTLIEVVVDQIAMVDQPFSTVKALHVAHNQPTSSEQGKRRSKKSQSRTPIAVGGTNKS